MKSVKTTPIVILLSTVIVFFLYHDIILNPDSYLFSITGDGLKNYFNYLYHIKYDSSYLSFNGMNYPYGESTVMVDLHPLLATFLKFVTQNIIDITPYTLSILNLLMLSSIIFCALFISLILDYYSLPKYASIGGGIAIAFLSSNPLLWEHGHYGLSYSCFFPIGWYFILKFHSSEKKILYSLIISTNILFWIYTHSYLGLIITGFTCLYHVFYLSLNKGKLNFNALLFLFIQVVLPLSIVYSVMKITDNHIGRIDMPPVYDYKASFYSVFLPNHSYLKPLYSFFLDLTPQSKESWCEIGNYIGLSTNLIIISFSFYFLFKTLVRRQWINPLFSKNEWAMILSSLVLLLYSMAIPFSYNMEFLRPDIIKQFMTLGRFAWPFYFVITVFSLKVLKSIVNKKLQTIIYVISILLLFTEGLSSHLYLKKKITQNHNLLKDNQYSNIVNQININAYQTMVTIPFYHHYISLHAYESNDYSEHMSMSLSYQTGIPLMNAILSRPSVEESKSIIQLLSPSYNQKPVLKKMNNLPILLAVSLKDPHTVYEQTVIDKAKKILSTTDFELYELSMDSILNEHTRNHVANFIKKQEMYQLDVKSNYRFLEEAPVYYNSFEEVNNKIVYRGKGSLAMFKNQLNVIYKSEPNQLKKDTEYNLSFWYYNHLYDQTFNTVWIELKDSTNTIYYSNYFDPCKSNYYDGNWAYNELVFTIKNATDEIGLYTQGANLFSDTVYVDELLLRVNSQNYYKISETVPDTIIIKNNHTIPVK